MSERGSTDIAPGTIPVIFHSFTDTAEFSIQTGAGGSRFSLGGRVAHVEFLGSNQGAFEGQGVNAVFGIAVDPDDSEWRSGFIEKFGRSDVCGSMHVRAGVESELFRDDSGIISEIAPVQIYVRTPMEVWRELRATCHAAFAIDHGVFGDFSFWWLDPNGSRFGNQLAGLDVSESAYHPIFSVSLSRSLPLPPPTEKCE